MARNPDARNGHRRKTDKMGKRRRRAKVRAVHRQHVQQVQGTVRAKMRHLRGRSISPDMDDDRIGARTNHHLPDRTVRAARRTGTVACHHQREAKHRRKQATHHDGIPGGSGAALSCGTWAAGPICHTPKRKTPPAQADGANSRTAVENAQAFAACAFAISFFTFSAPGDSSASLALARNPSRPPR